MRESDGTAVGAIADDCAALWSQIAAHEADILRRLAEVWALAEGETARSTPSTAVEREMPMRCIAAQIGGQARLHDRSVQNRMYDAWRLTTYFARTVESLDCGRISKAHADAMLDAGGVIDEPEVRAVFEEVVLVWAERETAGRTRTYALRLAEKLHPRPMDERFADAATGRSIAVADLADGMSEIVARVPTALARGILDRLTRQARIVAQDAAAQGGPGGCATADHRTMDQIRADVFSDLLLTGAPAIDVTTDAQPGGLGAVRAHVQLTMPVTTLTAVTQGGAELDGCSPIDPHTARMLAGGAAVWDRVLLDPVTAVVVAVDRYRPTPAQQRFLRARDQHCRMPGCRRPARLCQLDHNDEWHDGGPTRLGNLAHLCLRHHTLKSETGWTVRQLEGGRLEFTSPTGRVAVDEPPPRVYFVGTADPPPF